MKKLNKLQINSEKIMKNEELHSLRGGYGGPGSTNCCCIGSNGWPTICGTMSSESECSSVCSGNYWWY